MSGCARVTPGGVSGSDGSSFGPDSTPAVIGIVEAIAGSATLTRIYDVAQIKIGDPVCQGDFIETMTDGEVGIRFIDGTVLRLANESCLTLKHFVEDGASPSALFDISRGTFAFVAGEMAKAGRLSIDTPVATMRGRTQTGGIGMLSMAALYFAIMDDVHADSPNAALFDDGIIEYKDLAHGVFDVVTKEAIPRHFVVDDPGKTVVLHRLGSSVSADIVTNSATQMAQLQAAQQNVLQTFSLGLQQGPTTTGASGSGTSPTLLFQPPFVQPINYTPPIVNPSNGGSSSSGPDTGAPKPPPDVIIYIPPPATIQGSTALVERPAQTGDTTDDSTSVGLSSGTTATSGPATFVWSAGTLPSTEAAALMAASTLTITNSAGGLGLTFSAPDKTFDFLAANETLAINYDITISAGGGSSTQPVTFTVNGSNDLPMVTAQSLTGAVTEQAIPAGNLTDSGTIAFTDVDLTDVHLVSATPVGNGVLGTLTAVKNSDTTGTGNGGQLTWTYTVADSAVKYLAGGETKVESFIVTVDDQHGGVVTKQVDITITGSNDAAVIGAPTATDVTEDANVQSGNLVAAGIISISDADQNQASFQTTVTGSGNLGSLVLAANGSYTYTVANSAVQYLGNGDTKIDTFTITAFDGTAKQISFTIHGVNDAAVIGTPTVADVTEDTNVQSGNLVAAGTISISDADQNQGSFQTTVTGAAGNLGNLVLAANGSYTYTVANSAVQYLGVSDSKADTFTITALDGTIKQVAFTIHGVNDAAVIGTPTVADVTEDIAVNGSGNLTATGTISISDVDQNQGSFQTTVTGAAGNLGNLVLAANGAYTYTVANSAVRYLDENDTKIDTFTITALDGTIKQVAFTIHGVNDAAVIGVPTVADVTEDANVQSGNLVAAGTISISDVDQNQGSFQTTVTGTAGNLGSLVLAANGSYTYSVANGAVQFLGNGETKVDTFTITALDGTTEQVFFTIHGVNDAAVIGVPTVADVTEDTNVQSGNLVAAGTISISDADQNQGSLQTTVTGTAGNLGNLVLAANGSYTYSVANSAVQFLGNGETKTDTFTITALDGTAKQISFTIHGINDAAVIGTPTIADVTEDVAVNGSGNLTAAGTISISDVDQNQTSFQTTVTGSGNLGSLVLTANGSYIYTVANSAVQYLGNGDTKIDTFTITALDGTAKQISFTIHGANDAAVIGVPTVADVTEDTNVQSGNLVAAGTISISDADQNQASFQTTVSGSGNLGSLVLAANGSYTYSVANSAVQYLGVSDTKIDTFTITTLDGTIKQVAFTIHGVNDAAVIGTPTIADVTEDTNVQSGNLVAVGTISISDTDQNQGSFQTTVTGAAGNLGSLVLAANGSYTYSVANSAVQYLGGSDTKIDTFTITTLDGTIKQVAFTIHGVNDAAVIGTPTIADVTEDNNVQSGNLVAAGTISISDTDQNQASFQTTVTGSGNLGNLVLAANGSYTYTVANSAVQFLGNGDTKVDTFTITALDGTTKQVSFSIHGVNDAAVIGTPTVANVTEDVAVNGSGNLTAAGTISISDADQNQAAFQTTVTGSGNLGSLVLAANGSYTYSVANSAVQYLGNGDTKVDTFTIAALDGTTKQVSFTIHGADDAPVVTTGSATVSEEGLPGGNPDSVGTPTDTTNSTTASGALTISDVDSTSFSVTLGSPGAVLTSGGQPVTWSGVNSHTLVGSVGAKAILTVTIDDTGHYTVTLNGPIDHPDPTSEDIKTISIPVTVSDGILPTPTTISVTIEDDSPKADLVTTSVNPTGVQTNVMLILDLSGSMDDASGLTGLTRLDVAKAAINELLEQYHDRGNVMVRLVTFSDNGSANGTVWMTLDAAKTAIAGLSAGGNTNYDAGLLTAMSAFTSAGALSGPGTQNVSYFMSDGSPTVGTDWPQISGNQTTAGIQANEQAYWENFLTTNKIVSFAIGVGSGVTTSNLDPIAFDPAPGTQSADTPIVVTDLNQLSGTLVFTLPPVTGAFVAGQNGATQGSFGGDGGHIQSITVNNVTYTFNPAANGGLGSITTSGGGSPSFTYDTATKTLTVDTDTSTVGGELAIVMTTGAFTFQPTITFTGVSVGYVLVDNDGDTASSTLMFTTSGTVDHPPIVRDDHVITNITGSGAAIAIPSSALLYNDTDTDGNAITVTATSGATDGSVSPGSGNPITTVTFTDNNSNGGSFTYTGSTASPAASDTGVVTVDRSQTGTTLTGTGFGEILIGRNGTNNTINANGGDDVLIGGTGNDTLNGGAGADLMTGGAGADTFLIASGDSPGTVGGSGDTGTLAGYDVITDWSAGGTADHIDLPTTTIVANGAHNSATPSALTIGGATIKSYQVTNGIVTFDDAATYSAALTLTSLANVAAAVDFLHHNDIATGNGAAMAFTATIGGTVHTYVFEQVGTGQNATNDILVDLAGVSLSTLASSNLAPAGVAGEAINLGLTNPADHAGAVDVSIAGLPAGWTVSEGAGDGAATWTVQTNDVSALSMTAPAGFTGAIALRMSQTWVDSAGGSGFATITNNVEAFAPGSPIFAISGDDNLTGSSADDLYVFAQPIGHDVIHDFDAVHDRIDLIGYGLASFDDLKGHLTTDAGGNAMITLADGQSITLDGVAAASLNADNFVFDQTPVTTNAGVMTIGDGAVLPLSGIIDNSGTIALDSAGSTTTLQLIQHGITLQGGGQVVLSDSDGNFIAGAFPGITFTNVDNTISGAGQLVDSQTILVNEGTIVATGTHALLIDAGSNLITNSGTLEATGSGGLVVNGDIWNAGLIWAHGGNITIGGAATGTGDAIIDGGAVLEFTAASSLNVTFGESHFGTLVLDNPGTYTGHIFGFDGAGPQGSDVIDLKGIGFGAGTSWAYADNDGSNTGGTLAILETVNGVTTTVSNIAFADGDYTAANFLLTNDGHGGTLIVEPAAAPQTMSVFVGGPGNDNFVFSAAQHLGTSTISNFDTGFDSIELDGYSSINSANIAAAIATNGADALHGDAVINLGHGDSITVTGVTESYLQQHLNLIHLNAGVA